MAIVVAMIAVALPLCQTLVCDMLPSTMPHTAGTSLSRVCDLSTMTAPAPSGVVPTGAQPILFSLAMMIVMALAVVFPPRQQRYVLAVAEDPPAPPEDPRGVRLII